MVVVDSRDWVRPGGTLISLEELEGRETSLLSGAQSHSLWPSWGIRHCLFYPWDAVIGFLQPDSWGTEPNSSYWKFWRYEEAGRGVLECVVLVVHHRENQGSLPLYIVRVSL